VTRSVSVDIVPIGAVDDETSGRRLEPAQDRVERVLAVEAAVATIREVVGVFGFGRFHDFERNSEVRGHRPGLGALHFRDARRYLHHGRTRPTPSRSTATASR
jgi:hypothetical protein